MSSCGSHTVVSRARTFMWRAEARKSAPESKIYCMSADEETGQRRRDRRGRRERQGVRICGGMCKHVCTLRSSDRRDS